MSINQRRGNIIGDVATEEKSGSRAVVRGLTELKQEATLEVDGVLTSGVLSLEPRFDQGMETRQWCFRAAGKEYWFGESTLSAQSRGRSSR